MLKSNGVWTCRAFQIKVKRKNVSILWLRKTKPFTPSKRISIRVKAQNFNETARSYKTIALEAKEIDGFAFVWFTDGQGWKSARHNLEETFDVLDNMYCIADMENGIVKELFK